MVPAVASRWLGGLNAPAAPAAAVGGMPSAGVGRTMVSGAKEAEGRSSFVVIIVASFLSSLFGLHVYHINARIHTDSPRGDLDPFGLHVYHINNHFHVHPNLIFFLHPGLAGTSYQYMTLYSTVLELPLQYY